jgi:hypothetical protein
MFQRIGNMIISVSDKALLGLGKLMLFSALTVTLTTKRLLQWRKGNVTKDPRSE